jgi:hypothetical protein
VYKIQWIKMHSETVKLGTVSVWNSYLKMLVLTLTSAYYLNIYYKPTVVYSNKLLQITSPVLNREFNHQQILKFEGGVT